MNSPVLQRALRHGLTVVCGYEFTALVLDTPAVPPLTQYLRKMPWHVRAFVWGLFVGALTDHLFWRRVVQ